MAAKLQCEICGGKLIGKPGGFFECTICGTEYSTEWAREKLNGITADRNVQNPNMNTVNTCATMPIITVNVGSDYCDFIVRHADFSSLIRRRFPTAPCRYQSIPAAP